MNSRSKDTRLPTPYLPVTQLVCARAVKGSAYSVWRPNGTDSWHLIYTNGGAGQFSTRRGSFTAREGEIVLYAPGEMQDYGTSPDENCWDRTWVHFRLRPHWQTWLQWPHHAIGPRHLCLKSADIREPLQAALERMVEFSRRSISGAPDFAVNALEEALLWTNAAASLTKGVAQDERVRQAADYLSAHLREPFRLEKLATICGLSVSRLAHLFKEQTGTTPQQFLEQRRIQHACHLLRLTDLSVSEVAAEVGYADPFYFSNRFRRHIGQSPLQFRRQRDSEETFAKGVSSTVQTA